MRRSEAASAPAGLKGKRSSSNNANKTTASGGRQRHGSGAGGGVESHTFHQAVNVNQWPLRRIVMVAVASIVSVFTVYFLVSSASPRDVTPSTQATGAGPNEALPSSPQSLEGQRKQRSMRGAQDGEGGGSPLQRGPAPKRRGFNHDGEGGTNRPKPPITKPRGIVSHAEFITTTDAFINMARAMSTEPLNLAAQRRNLHLPEQGNNALLRPDETSVRRVDACGPPFLSWAHADVLNTSAKSVTASDYYERSALKQYLYNEVEALLSCGPRVGGAPESKGYQCAMAYLRERMKCDVGDSSLHAEGEGALPRPTTRRWWEASINTFDKVRTVVGEKYFSNFVAEFSAGDEARYGHLVIAAHWDSKDIKPDAVTGKQFVAATDSAVPVVLILEIMKYVSTYAEMLRKASGDSDEGLEIPLPRISILLFDGEEAFLEWKGDDNTYGSRLEAAQWKKDRKLKGISTFMLLDLIGAADSQMHNLFHGQSGRQYASLRNIEMAFMDSDMERVREGAEAVAYCNEQLARQANANRSSEPGAGSKTTDDNNCFVKFSASPEWRHWPIDALGRESLSFTSAKINVNGERPENRPFARVFDDQSSSRHEIPPQSKGIQKGGAKKPSAVARSQSAVVTRDSYFPREPLGIRYGIEDDHLPWLREGVPILHLISVPFPQVWHTLDDDHAHVHYDTVYEYLRVFTEFILTNTKMGADPQRA